MRPGSRRESKCEIHGTFIFYRRRASRSLVAGISHRGGWPRARRGEGGRSGDEVAEQGDGDEVHLAERTSDEGEGAIRRRW